MSATPAERLEDAKWCPVIPRRISFKIDNLRTTMFASRNSMRSCMCLAVSSFSWTEFSIDFPKPGEWSGDPGC